MSTTKNSKSKRVFPGYQRPNYTMVPDELFDDQLADLTEAELKVLLYIIRRTFGFKRDSDNISLKQMVAGITTRDGRTLDRGTGLSKKSVLQALRSLEERNLIRTERRRSVEKGDEPTSYRLNVLGTTSGEESAPPVGKNLRQGGGEKSSPGPWGKMYTTQDRVEQYTVEQQRDSSNNRDFEPETDQSNRGEVWRGDQAPSPREQPAPRPRSHPTSVGQLLRRTELRLMDRPGAPRHQPRRRRPDAPESIEALITQWSGIDLNDPDHYGSNVTQATNIFRASGLSEAAFIAKMYEARTVTLKQGGRIKKRAEQGHWEKNSAPYFFSVLRDLLGMKWDSADDPSPGRLG